MKATDHLNQFISDKESFSWSESTIPGRFTLFSGIWKGGLWKHDVVVLKPDEMRPSTALLYVTGGSVNEPDLIEARAIADRSGLAVAMLFDIPNQPLFELREDDLIAHTFELYLETGDPTWPLLFPMVRAAIRAIDLLKEIGFDRVVVTGASKRGWTTWLAGATGDPRIVGIAPMVFDNLDFPAQMAHQMSQWGGFSEQIEDYSSRDLQASMDSERGAELTSMMDPVRYIDRIRCPILIINGANDRYWTVDALSLYWDRLPSTSKCLVVPNAGHLLGDKVMMVETLSAFAHACDIDELLPEVYFEAECADRLVSANICSPPQEDFCRLWAAFSATQDFRDSEWLIEWHSQLISEPAQTAKPVSDRLLIEAGLLSSSPPAVTRLLAALRPETSVNLPWRNVALMTESIFKGPTGSFSLSTPVKVFPVKNDSEPAP